MNQLNNIRQVPEDYLSILHIDRLEITLRHVEGSIFGNYRNPDLIPEEQVYGEIRLLLDNSKGAAAYHNTYIVLFNGIRVGKLHSANKMRKPDVEFDIDKEVLYAVNENWWYEIYTSLMTELGLAFNNIKYVEIALDTTKNLVDGYRLLYSNTEQNQSHVESFFRLHGRSKVDVLGNGSSFNIRGKCNMISIYEKTKHAEKYILDFFQLNGFGDSPVYRVEARVNWNYLKSKMYHDKVIINVETLLDRRMLATLFSFSVDNKLILKDLRTKCYDKNRNAKYKKISILEGIKPETSGLLQFNPAPNNSHYKENVDVDILRHNYYRFLETSNPQYFKNFKASGVAAGYNRGQMFSLIERFNCKYKGNRTLPIKERMVFVNSKYVKKPTSNKLWSFLKGPEKWFSFL